MRRRPASRSWCSLLAAITAAGAIIAGCGESPERTPSAAPTAEARLRAELGVPAAAARVLIISQSSHLDWDWLHTFDDYYQQSVDGIFLNALQLLTQYHAAPAHYFYSVAEVAYLQRFAAIHPDLLQPLRHVDQDLRIVGGGITSPDNLLPSGEAFIRDYLMGKTWVDQNLGLPIRQAWLPDDFGHDAQLPIVLEAMGLEGVGFARVPGVDTSARFSFGAAPPPGSVAAELLQEGLDFVWQARDGSETLAHWMPGSYCQGDPPLRSPLSTIAAIQQVLATNQPASPTPYIFVPIGCDFKPPQAGLLDLVSMWNAQEYARTGVWAVAATFDHYEQLVGAHREALRTRRFDPTPYWTGFYASRPVLKTLHLRATQALLGAEIFGAIADATARDSEGAWLEQVRARTDAIGTGWATLVPGNHHDFITGTALDDVYQGEQIPRLRTAISQGETERTRAMSEIAGAIAPQQGGEQAVVVFNQLGFERQGIAEVAGFQGGFPEGATVQSSAEGGTLFVAQVPSLGYAVADSAAIEVPATQQVLLTMSADGSTVVLENATLRATISRESGWGLTSVIDKQTGHETIASGQVGNSFGVYRDDGGLYRFGDEMGRCHLTLDGALETAAGDATVMESGPLRAWVAGQVVIDGQTFEKEYQLVAGEPFLRMRSTGAAPIATSVLVRFPLAGAIDDLAFGTAYHWHHEVPARARTLTFEATHEFLVPSFQGHPLAAFFHAGVPAWAAQPDGGVMAALWRNAHQEVCDAYGASGTDADPHPVDYALRVASGISDPEHGGQLREALGFEMPLQAIVGTPSGTLPRSFSLASVTPDSAVITAAKAATADPSTLILRIYQPTDASLQINVRTGALLRFPAAWRLNVHGRTALESDLPAAAVSRLALSGSADAFSFVATRALTTVAIGLDAASPGT
jgi:alpha-mannosidase